MSTTGASSGVSGQQGQQTTTGNAFNSLNTESFIKMLVAELQSQDPTNPASNTEILQQVSQIKAIQSDDNLSTTLQSVQLGQSLATASNLIGRTVSGKDTNGDAVSGQVTKVSIDNSLPTLYVGDQSLPLANVTDILPAGTATSATSGTQSPSS
jgi:flagellar basal-body rod modification protein FlgD